MMRRKLFLIVAIVLLSNAFNMVALRAQDSADEAAIRKLVKRLFDAYQKKNLDGVMACWSVSSPMFADFKQFLLTDFTSSEETQFVNVTLTRWKIETNRASVRLRFARRWRDARTKQPAEEKTVQEVQFVKERAAWKFWLQMDPAINLAERLDAAKTKAERIALLDDEKEIVTPDLLRMFVVTGVRYASERKFDDASRLNDISFLIADLLGGADAKGQSYWFRASIFRYQLKYREALDDYQSALRLAREAKSRRREAVTLKNIGEIYQLQNKYDEAATQFEESAKVMREIGEKEEEGKIFNTLGLIYELNARYPEAIVALKESLKIALELGNKGGEASVRNNLGIIYRLTGKFPDALAQHEASLKIKYAMGNKKEVASGLDNIGNVYQSMGEYQKALTQYQMGLEQYREIHDKDGEAKTLNDIGVVYQLINRYPDALAQHTESLKIAHEARNQAEELKARGNIGLIYRSTGRYAEGLKHFENNLKFAREVGDREYEVVSHVSIGNVHTVTGRYADASMQYQAGLKVARETDKKAGEIATRNGIGEIYRLTGKYPEALEQYDASLKIARDIGDKEAEAGTLANIGGVYMATSKYAEAIPHYEARLNIAREMSDRAGVVASLNNIGVAYVAMSEYPEARARFEESLKLARELGSRASEASTLNNLGEVYRLTGKYAEAMGQYQASLKIKLEIGDKEEETITLVNIGLVHMLTGRYAEALTQFEASLKIARELGYKPGEALALGDIGLIYMLTGKYDEALRHYETTLMLMREMGDRGGESKALGNIGSLYQSTGKYNEALIHLAASLKILIEIGDRADEAAARGSIAEVYRLTGKYADALTEYNASLKIAREIGDRPKEAVGLHNSGLAQESLGKHDEAMEQFEASLKILQEVGDRFGEAILQTNIADLYQTQKKWQQAADTYRKAIPLIETIRTQAKEPSLQTGFFAQHTSPYYGLIETLLELGSSRDEIFAVSERAKARTLVELMTGSKVNILKSMTDSERKREQELKATLIAAAVQLNSAYSGPAPDERRVDELTRQLNKVRDDYAEFRVKLFIVHPELQFQRAGYDSLTLAQLSKPLFAKNPKLCLLSYVVADNKTFLIVITGGKNSSAPVNFNVFTLKTKQGRALTASELNNLLNEFRKRCANESGPYKQLARDLYDYLLAPARNELKNRPYVVIIPDGALHALPFQALVDEKGEHFLESHTVSYAPSVTALIEMMKLADRKKKANLGIQPLFAMGRGSFPDQALYRNSDLPKAEEQVKSIARLFGVTPWIGTEATKANALLKMGTSRYVHFATHGELNEVAPMESTIVLGRGPADDGMLYARELVDMELQAELVVLSACDTGLGQSVSGEGILGLTWALFVAGTPTSVVTQWQVSDDSMNRLMLEFYRQMRLPSASGRPAITKAEALRRAQLSLMKSRGFEHPYYWAPVALVGDWR